ncbi:UbiA prenyltransferase family protein [Candidatus Parcubacteria bacterium]|nr:UbiA prenyltransferase family protein [Candidatus Parcubacteria bacterium]
MDIKAYIKLARPHHWVKNVLIFLPAFFAGVISNSHIFLSVLYSFITFCLAASAVYAVNDLLDLHTDKEHEIKRLRPLASGRISPKEGFAIALGLFVVATLLAYALVPSTLKLLLVYGAINILYSYSLKHIPVVDLIIFTVLYLIRIMVGGEAAGVPVSEWLILCTIFLSLFLVVAKRFAELERQGRRRVLQFYSAKFLETLLVMSATLSIISFALYTIIGHSDKLLVYSNLFVIFGISRYFFLVYSSSHAESPEKALFHDWWLLCGVVAWAGYLLWVFY